MGRSPSSTLKTPREGVRQESCQHSKPEIGIAGSDRAENGFRENLPVALLRYSQMRYLSGMYDRDDLTVIDTAGDLNSPLDAIAPEESESAAAPPPDPEEMLALLAAPHAPQRMLAARAFCDLKEARAIRPLLALLRDDCALVRVSAAYALGRNTAPEAVEPLIDQYERDWNGYVRKGINCPFRSKPCRKSPFALVFAA